MTSHKFDLKVYPFCQPFVKQITHLFSIMHLLTPSHPSLCDVICEIPLHICLKIVVIICLVLRDSLKSSDYYWPVARPV